MRMLNLQDTFHLFMQPSNPGIIQMHYKSIYRGKSHEMSVLDFINVLPVVIPIPPIVDLAGTPYNQRNSFGFISNETEKKERFLHHLSYKYYHHLELDLKRINPHYQFIKKANVTLADPTYYFKEATKNMTVKEVASSISPMNDVISFDTFHQYFHLLNQSDATYTLSFFDVPKVEPLYEFIKEKMHPFPAYSLTGNQKEMLLYYVNDTFFVVTHDLKDIQVFSFLSHEKEALAQKIESFFPIDENVKFPHLNDINVQSIKENFWMKKVKTTASFVGDIRSIQDELSSMRTFFSEKYQIKARGKHELWEKGMKKITEQPLTLDYPFFGNMSSLEKEDKTLTRNQEIIEKIHAEASTEKTNSMIQLFSVNQNGVFDQHHSLDTRFNHIVNQHSSLYMMPDYGELASKAPSFSDIINKKNK